MVVSYTLFFFGIYLIPALVVAFVLWVIWNSLCIHISKQVYRRIVFVVLVTLGLSPVIVPAGTIMAAWVPHAVVMISPQLGYYFKFASSVFISFLVTATIASVIAIRWVHEKPHAPPSEYHRRW